ncbi:MULTISPECIES: amino acid ABC transporter ATP-binding protein [unclassified Chelatococcus]|uniref:amino acid ABC transporter ATP-binding protein n=1 Tax=unclassified Chelatococcus TaxID=2638111 RepID=UPI0024BE4D97|nr:MULTISPECIES: amino acid ABC transporter ATP-binding protein [unclassified Chelatococcus]
MTQTMIEAIGLNKYFSDFHVLRNIDLQVKSGERVVLCGPSGSGKSTLIRCLNGLEPHQGGELSVCGIALTDKRKSIDLVRRRTGMVFQNFNLFPHMTAVENCMVAPMRVRGLKREEARAVAEKYLRRVHVEDQINKYPSQLSGGQQQRVAIARALAMSPDVMLFDEPTSALDPEMVGEVLDTMTEIANEGTTMICVTHEMGFARKIADRIIFMDAGAIVETAPPEEFFTNSRTARAREFLSWVMH